VTPPRTRTEDATLLSVYTHICADREEREKRAREYELKEDRASERVSNIKVRGGDNMLKHETSDGEEENWNAAVVLAC